MRVLSIGDRWFAHQRVDDAITLLVEQFTDPLIRCNIWHVRGQDHDLVIDTGLGMVSLRRELESLTARPVVAVATHGHFDHIGGLYEFDERLGHIGDVIDLGDRAFVVLHLPGHSPGSIALWDPAGRVLFSGDTVYDGGLLDSLPGSDVEQYAKSMRRLRLLPVDVVHGGHEPSFGPGRLVELIDGYLATADRVGMAM